MEGFPGVCPLIFQYKFVSTGYSLVWKHQFYREETREAECLQFIARRKINPTANYRQDAHAHAASAPSNTGQHPLSQLGELLSYSGFLSTSVSQYFPLF